MTCLCGVMACIGPFFLAYALVAKKQDISYFDRIAVYGCGVLWETSRATLLMFYNSSLVGCGIEVV